jgi:hypothetical protein
VSAYQWAYLDQVPHGARLIGVSIYAYGQTKIEVVAESKLTGDERVIDTQDSAPKGGHGAWQNSVTCDHDVDSVTESLLVRVDSTVKVICAQTTYAVMSVGWDGKVAERRIVL